MTSQSHTFAWFMLLVQQVRINLAPLLCCCKLGCLSLVWAVQSEQTEGGLKETGAKKDNRRKQMCFLSIEACKPVLEENDEPENEHHMFPLTFIRLIRPSWQETEDFTEIIFWCKRKRRAEIQRSPNFPLMQTNLAVQKGHQHSSAAVY